MKFQCKNLLVPFLQAPMAPCSRQRTGSRERLLPSRWSGWTRMMKYGSSRVSYCACTYHGIISIGGHTKCLVWLQKNLLPYYQSHCWWNVESRNIDKWWSWNEFTLFSFYASLYVTTELSSLCIIGSSLWSLVDIQANQVIKIGHEIVWELMFLLLISLWGKQLSVMQFWMSSPRECPAQLWERSAYWRSWNTRI